MKKINPVVVTTCKIPLNGSDRFAFVDAEDFPRLSQFKWNFHPKGYAHRNLKRGDGSYTTIRMHREIMGAPIGVQVDHEDGDGLNNRRKNLRLATNQQNQGNRKVNRNKSRSRFKGVALRTKGAYFRWVARIGLNGKRVHLGSFRTEDEAALVYNAAAVEHFGDFARLNEVEH